MKVVCLAGRSTTSLSVYYHTATSSADSSRWPASPSPLGLVHDDVALPMLSARATSWFEITGERAVASSRG